MVTIRKADKADLQAIHDMAQVVFRHTYRAILSPEQMDYMMDMMYSLPNLRQQLDEGHHYYIAYGTVIEPSDCAPAVMYEACETAGLDEVDEQDATCGMPLGYVSVQRQGADADGIEVFHLHKIYVMPQSQGRGVGMCLFQTVIDHVRAEMTGAPLTEARIELNVNKHNSAVAFYKHIGMHIIHEEDYPIGNGFYKTDYIMALGL